MSSHDEPPFQAGSLDENGLTSSRGRRTSASRALCNQTIWPRPFCGEKHCKIRATGPSLGMKMLDILLPFATCRSLLRLSKAPARPQALDTHPGEEHGNGGQRSR